MPTCIYTFVWVYIHIFTHTYVCIYVYLYLYLFIYLYIYVYVCLSIYMSIDISTWYLALQAFQGPCRLLHQYTRPTLTTPIHSPHTYYTNTLTLHLLHQYTHPTLTTPVHSPHTYYTNTLAPHLLHQYTRPTLTTPIHSPYTYYGMASISRLLKIIGLFCKRTLQKRLYSAKETCNFQEPNNRSQPIHQHTLPALEHCTILIHVCVSPTNTFISEYIHI